MSQSVPPESFEAAGTAAEPVAAAKAPFRDRYLRLPRRRPRLLALGAAVVVLGVAGVGAAAVVHHGLEHEGGRHGHFAAGHEGAGEGHHGEDASNLGEGGDHAHGHGRSGHGDGEGGGLPGADRSTDGAELAPAPIPAVPADQAVAKAVAAVPGGKADALRVVGQQGGGSAWAVEVLGADGVRHLVTVDGTAGSVTGNTVLSAAAGQN
ncbi:hypothetical protein [Saccharothrix sp. ST-888]|uniref:hypothetical protein n=1 Tax=Saccharothrix sp. ST-888 TaxID=1427391 RepID=UPI0005EC04DB|nr:hypothetical protein [Saccharothrix sp. ST-888]KJK59928.1 hypothetical protein UK12_00110 [Saccharothrix sp. ST-888]